MWMTRAGWQWPSRTTSLRWRRCHQTLMAPWGQGGEQHRAGVWPSWIDDIVYFDQRSDLRSSTHNAKRDTGHGCLIVNLLRGSASEDPQELSVTDICSPAALLFKGHMACQRRLATHPRRAYSYQAAVDWCRAFRSRLPGRSCFIWVDTQNPGGSTQWEWWNFLREPRRVNPE